MSIIVKGMQIPENCRECPFENYHSDIGQTVCMASLRVLATGFKTISFDGRHCSCPLVALPDKHGRLVDADEIRGRMESVFNTSSNLVIGHTWGEAYAGGFSDAIDIVKDAPTIVESEDES